MDESTGSIRSLYTILPSEIIELIYNTLDDTTRCILCFVDKYTYNIINKNNDVKFNEYSQKYIISKGILNLVKWWFDNGYRRLSEYGSNGYNCAGRHGYLDIIKMMYHDYNVSIDVKNDSPFHEALRNGYFNIVEWGIENKIPTIDNYLEKSLSLWAAYYNRIDILYWCKKNEYAISRRASYYAAYNGHINVLDWLQNNQNDLLVEDSETYLPEKKVPMCKLYPRDAYNAAAYCKRKDIIKWLIKNNYILTSDGQLEFLYRLLQKNLQNMYNWYNKTINLYGGHSSIMACTGSYDNFIELESSSKGYENDMDINDNETTILDILKLMHNCDFFNVDLKYIQSNESKIAVHEKWNDCWPMNIENADYEIPVANAIDRKFYDVANFLKHLGLPYYTNKTLRSAIRINDDKLINHLLNYVTPRTENYDNVFNDEFRACYYIKNYINYNYTEIHIISECVWAAYTGKLEILKLLHCNNFVLRDIVMYTAAICQHLDILNWLYENKCPYDIECLEYYIINSNNQELYNWFVTKGFTFSEQCKKHPIYRN